MKNTLTIGIAMLALNVALAQEFKTEVGSVFKKDNPEEVVRLAFPSAYGFITYSHLDNVMMDNTKAIKLTKYDQAMQAVSSQTFTLPKLGNRASDLQKVVETNGNLIFLSTVMDKKSGKHQLNAQVYSEKENTVSENKVLSSIAIEGYSNSGFYQVAVSTDSSKIAILANMPFEKKTREQVKVLLFDAGLNLQWEQTATLNFDSERAYREKIMVSNSGQVFLNKIIDIDKKTRSAHLLEFNGITVGETIFSSEGFQPLNMKLIEMNNNPALAGFYWNGSSAIIKINTEEGEETSGAFLYDLNNRKLTAKHEWSNGLNAKDLKSLEVVEVALTDDAIYMVGEKQLTKSDFREGGTSLGVVIDYFYTYGSSVLVAMDIQGTLLGFTPLFNAKNFKNTEKEKGSLAALYLENGLRIFANNDYITQYTYFTEQPTSFPVPKVRTNSGMGEIPYLIPATVKAVENYNLVYFITNYGNEYWVNRMTW